MRWLVVLLFALAVASVAPAWACDIAVRLDAALTLQLDYDCPAGIERLDLDRSTRQDAIRAVVLSDGTALKADGEGWRVPADRPVRFGYRFDLAGAAARSDNVRGATRVGDSILALLPVWLLQPVGPAAPATLRLKIETPPGLDFAAGLAQADGRYLVQTADLWAAGYTLFGKLARTPVTLSYPAELGGQAVLDVVRLDGGFALPTPEIIDWITRSARGVADYYGGFPAQQALLALIPTPGRGVRFGRVVAGSGVTIILQLGTEATREALYDDWVLVHELSHVGGPFLPDGRWFMEGMATYVEPIIRARAGLKSAEWAWHELQGGMGRGMPAMTEIGLNRTGMPGIYWGGAAFMLAADLEIRRRSQGQKGLEHALRAVLWGRGNASMRWTLPEMIAACDAAVGQPVMTELAAKYGPRGSPFDLDGLWRELGVEAAGESVRLRDDAPSVRLRDAMLTGRPVRP